MWSARRAVEPAASGASQAGGCSEPIVGPNREAAGGVSRRATSLATATAANSRPDMAVMISAMPTPVSSRRRRTAVPPWSRRAIPNPLNRLVASSASNHG